MSTGAGPVRVMFVDVDRPLPTVEAERAEGGRYGAALVVATSRGRPLGAVELPLPNQPVPAEELRARLESLMDSGSTVDTESTGFTVDTPAGPLPPASVVVPTMFGRPQSLAACVASLSTMGYPDFEVLVVDNRPRPDESDWTPVLAVPGVRVLAQPRPGASAARNLGALHARGEIVAFTDDDVTVDRGWLRALVGRFLAEPDVDCVTGLVLPAELETPAQVLFELSGGGPQRRYRKATFRTGDDPFSVMDRWADDPGLSTSIYAMGPFGAGCNLAMRASALRETGGFDEALGPGTPTRAGEDLLLLLRLLTAGRVLAVEPGAFVLHRHRRYEAELRRQMYGYGVGFAAMLTAAVHRDRRHLRGLWAVARPALGSLTSGGAGRGARSDRYPRTLVLARLAGLAVGPFAYLVSQSKMRRWR